MARIPRILITGDPTVCHIISRTAMDKLNTHQLKAGGLEGWRGGGVEGWKERGVGKA